MKIVKVRVTPRANKNEIIETLADGTIKVRLKAPPVDNLANEELIKFLSKKWQIMKSQIKIIKGKTSKNKIIQIDN